MNIWRDVVKDYDIVAYGPNKGIFIGNKVYDIKGKHYTDALAIENVDEIYRTKTGDILDALTFNIAAMEEVLNKMGYDMMVMYMNAAGQVKMIRAWTEEDIGEEVKENKVVLIETDDGQRFIGNIAEYVGPVHMLRHNINGEEHGARVIRIIDLKEDQDAITIDEEEVIKFIEQDTMLNKLDIQMVLDSYDRYLYSKGLLDEL